LTKISNLEERVDQLNQNRDPSLTTEEANTVRAFWIQLNYTPKEAREYFTLNKRRKLLYENYLAGRRAPGEAEEWTNVTGRMTEIAHDIVMRRVIANRSLRDRVWPDLAPRVLRFCKLTEKPTEELTSNEAKELESLQEWFNELQREALGETSKQ
jgi:hypothetical protein